jgi:hypothetical protein
MMTDNFSADNANKEPANTQESSSKQAPKKAPKKENMLINILMNIVIPTLILTKLSGPQHLGVVWGLVVALAFPVVYGLTDFVKNRKINFFSALGIFSVLLTGGIGILKLPTEYYAIKEAAIPGLIGLVVLISTKTRFPLVKTFIYNDTILNVEKIAAKLKEHNKTDAFEKTLRIGSYLLAASFFLSSTLNYILAKMIVMSPAGTEAFNIEVGKMNALSFPIIAIPSMIIMVATLMYIFRSIRLLTGLTFEEAMHDTSNKS